MSNNSTILRDRRKNPAIFSVPVLSESIDSFRARLVKPGIVTRNLGVIGAGRPVHCVGYPFTIKHAEHIMYGVIVKIDGSTQKYSLIIKTPRNPLYFKGNSVACANIKNTKC